MKKFLFLLILINFFLIKSQAQSQELDSLLVLLQNHQVEDTIRVNLLNKIARKHAYSNIEKLLSYTEEAKELANKLNYPKGIAKSLKHEGIYFYFKSDFPKALERFQQSLNLNIVLDIKIEIAGCYNNIGVIYKNRGNYLLAIENYNKSLIIHELVNNFDGIAATYMNIGNIYTILGEYQKAIEYAQKALVINEEAGKELSTSYCYSNIADAFNSQQKDSLALEYYFKSLAIRKRFGDKNGVSVTYTKFGNIYCRKNDYPKAMEYFQEALKISKEIGNLNQQAKIYNELGLAFLKRNKFEKAYQNSKKAYEIAQQTGSRSIISKSSKTIAISSEATGDYKEAYIHQVIHKTINDSLNKTENIKKIASLEFQHKYEKDLQLAEQEQQKIDTLNAEELKRQKVMRNSLIVGFLLLLVIVFIIYRNFIQKRKANAILTKQKEEIQSQAEELDIRNAKLKDLNATKDKFFSIISHDLKNPFNTLLGMSDLLLDDSQEYDEKQRKEYLQYINDSSSKTYKLLENLLTWSKSQTGSIDYMPEKIKLRPLVKEQVLLFKESFEIKGVNMQITIEKSLKVYGDKNMLETIFRNLISNAIKFTNEGGEISILAKSSNKNPLFTQVAIVDTGIGISKEKQSKLFDVSEHVMTKDTENEKGTGLGLILCKEFVNNQGGEIWLESEEGKGTTVYFTIPAKKIASERIKKQLKEE